MFQNAQHLWEAGADTQKMCADYFFKAGEFAADAKSKRRYFVSAKDHYTRAKARYANYIQAREDAETAAIRAKPEHAAFYHKAAECGQLADASDKMAYPDGDRTRSEEELHQEQWRSSMTDSTGPYEQYK